MKKTGVWWEKLPSIQCQDNECLILNFKYCSDFHAVENFTTYFLTRAQHLLLEKGSLIVKTSRSHSNTAHSIGLLWTSDQPDAKTSTWRHTAVPHSQQTHNSTTLTTDTQQCHTQNRHTAVPHSQQTHSSATLTTDTQQSHTHNPSKRETVVPRLKPRDHWDQLPIALQNIIVNFIINKHIFKLFCWYLRWLQLYYNFRGVST